MINGTSSNQDHTIRRVVGLDVVRQVIALNGENIGLWPEDGSAKRLTWWRPGQLVDTTLEQSTDLGKPLNGGGRKQPLLTACQPLAVLSV